MTLSRDELREDHGTLTRKCLAAAIDPRKRNTLPKDSPKRRIVVQKQDR